MSGALEIATTVGTWILAFAAPASLSSQVLASRAIESQTFSDFTKGWDSAEMRARRGRLARALPTAAATNQTLALQVLVTDVIDLFEVPSPYDPDQFPDEK